MNHHLKLAIVVLVVIAVAVRVGPVKDFVFDKKLN